MHSNRERHGEKLEKNVLAEIAITNSGRRAINKSTFIAGSHSQKLIVKGRCHEALRIHTPEPVWVVP